MVKAAVLYEVNKLIEIKNLRQQDPKNSEVKIKMLSAGICASDYHVIKGETNFPLPIVLGHEGAGIVVDIGENVTSVKKGNKCILSFVPSCGFCYSCRKGLGNICDTNRLTGTKQFDGTFRLKDDNDNDIHQFAKLGVFAEEIIVPESACFKIEDDFPIDVACLIGCSVTTGVGGVINQENIFPGASIAIFGAGGVGLNAILGGKIINASKIIAVDILDNKLEFAHKFGATHVLNSKEIDPIQKILEITNGIGVDFGFDTFGSQMTTNQMMGSIRKGGTGVIIGLAPEGQTANINMVDIVRNHKTLLGSYYGSLSPHLTFERIIEFYKSGKLDIDSVIQRKYPLEKINEAYNDLATGKDGRGVIDFSL